MQIQNVVARPIRRPQLASAADHHSVRLPVGADSKLFGGWGVRF